MHLSQSNPGQQKDQKYDQPRRSISQYRIVNILYLIGYSLENRN